MFSSAGRPTFFFFFHFVSTLDSDMIETVVPLGGENGQQKARQKDKLAKLESEK